jgi:hypothetical protein
MAENKMIENKDEVSQAIRKLADDNGYDFFNNGGPNPPREHEKVLYLAFQPKEGDKRPLLNFVVAICSNRFRVTFDGAIIPKYCKDLGQLLDFIKDWLLTR